MKLKIANENLGYLSESEFIRNFSLSVLEFYLTDHLDTLSWRKRLEAEAELHPELDYTPITSNGKLYPKWALNDFYVLIRNNPLLKEKIFKDINTRWLPSLDEVIKYSSTGKN